MSGVEFIAVLGIASNVIAVVDACAKIQDRIQSYRQNTAFQDLALQLPLLVSAIESLRDPKCRDVLDPSTEKALIRVLDGCLRQLQKLDALLKDLTPSNAASKLQKTWKGIRSFGKDTKVREIIGTLTEYKSTITLHLSTVHVRKITNPHTSPLAKGTYFDVPYSRLSHFVGRTEALSRIQTALQASHNNPSIVVLTGVGGQGKTQIALEFCHTNLNVYRGVFWVDASSQTAVSRGYERILKIIDNTAILASGEENKSFVKNALRNWKESWLLIFDNYDDPKSFSELSSFFPVATGGKSAIIVTSRQLSSGRLGIHLKLDGFTEEEGVRLLTSRCSSVVYDENETKEGRDIIKKLGYLPLAIDQAACYISIRRLPLHMFSDHFQKRKEFILKDTPQSLWEYRKRNPADPKGSSENLSVLTTWELSFAQISGNDEERKLIGEFLALAAHFNPRSISETLFHNAKTVNWKLIFSTGGSWDSFKFQDIVVGLVNLSIIQTMEITGDDISFSFHPLVKDWLQLRESVGRRREYGKLATTLTASFIQEKDTEMLHLQKRQELLSHIDACTENDSSFLTDQQSILEYGGFVEGYQTTFATFYGQHDRSLDAERLFHRSLTIQVSQLGEYNIATLSTMNNLAALYLDSKRLDDAWPLLFRTLEIKEHMFGSEHPRTLNTVNNLGNLFVLQSNFDDATRMYERTLVGYQKSSVLHYKTVVECLNNLGEVAMKKANFPEAERLFQEGLRRLKVFCGDEEDGLALYMNSNLALVYKLQHQYKEAESAYHELIEKRKALFGSQHSSTLQSMCELGDVYFSLGQLRLAGEWYLQGGASRERVLTGTATYSTPSEEAENLYLNFGLLASLNDHGIPEISYEGSLAHIDQRGASIADDFVEESGPNIPNSGTLGQHHPTTDQLTDSCLSQTPSDNSQMRDIGVSGPQSQSLHRVGVSMRQSTRIPTFHPMDRGGLAMFQQASSDHFSAIDRRGLQMAQAAPAHNSHSLINNSSIQMQKVEWRKIAAPSSWKPSATNDYDICESHSSPLSTQDSIDRRVRLIRNRQLAIGRLKSVLPPNSTPIRKSNQHTDRSPRARRLEVDQTKLKANSHSGIGVGQDLESVDVSDKNDTK